VAARRSLAGAWDPAVRAEVAAAFRASRQPGARDRLSRVEAALDRRAGAIASMRRDACEATMVRGEQSAELLDRRVECLDRRVAELRALTGLFRRADDELIGRSVEAALALAPIDGCADSAALLAAVPPPDQPALRARVEAVRRKLADVDALEAAGRYVAGHAAARALAAETAGLGYPRVHAEALEQQGELELRMSDADAALVSFEAAMAAAAAARDDERFARALVQLYHLTGYGAHRFAEAAALLPVARAAVARAGGRPNLTALLDGAIGAVAEGEGRYQDAADAFRRALRATEAARGPDDPKVASALNNLGQSSLSLGRYRDALDAHRRALAIREKVFGADHPLVANSLSSVGAVLNQLAENEESLAAFRRALAIREAALGPDHLMVADTLDSIGLVLADLEREEEALAHHRRALVLREKRLPSDHLDLASGLAKLGSILHGMDRDAEAIPYHERALAIREKKLGPTHPEVAGTLNNMALAVRRTDHARARALLRRALAIREKALAPDHPDIASTVNNLALEEFEAGRHAEARALYRRAIPIWEKRLGADHPSTLMAIYYLGKVELGARRAAQAAALFDRALTGYRAAGARAPAGAALSAQLALAEALWRAHRPGDRPRARKLVAGALETLLASGRTSDAAQLRRWLATHRR
jgi:serine/threonine-protein kinase